MAREHRIDIDIMSKRGVVRTVAAPTIMVVCPACEGRSLRDGCYCCAGANVVEEADLAKYPRISAAWKRYDRQVQADAWERYGERVMGA